MKGRDAMVSMLKRAAGGRHPGRRQQPRQLQRDLQPVGNPEVMKGRDAMVSMLKRAAGGDSPSGKDGAMASAGAQKAGRAEDERGEARGKSEWGGGGAGEE